MKYAFQVLGFHRIEAGVMPHNTGSIRVLQKAGFHSEGLNKKNVLINGRWEDHLYFAIVNSIRRARTDEGPILSDLAFRSKAVWGGATMVSRGRVFHLADLNSLIAKSGGEYVGAVTYRFEDNGDCELISINTTGRGTGVGTNLLAAVEGEARHVETQPDVLGASALSPLVPDTCS